MVLDGLFKPGGELRKPHTRQTVPLLDQQHGEHLLPKQMNSSLPGSLKTGAGQAFEISTLVEVCGFHYSLEAL